MSASFHSKRGKDVGVSLLAVCSALSLAVALNVPQQDPSPKLSSYLLDTAAMQQSSAALHSSQDPLPLLVDSVLEEDEQTGEDTQIKFQSDGERDTDDALFLDENLRFQDFANERQNSDHSASMIVFLCVAIFLALTIVCLIAAIVHVHRTHFANQVA